MSGACAAWLNNYDAIWHVDFEFRQDANHLPVPVCMFAYEQHTGASIELWRDQLLQMRRAPFDSGPRSLMVAYAANAELSCFLALGWEFPRNVLDLYVETIAAINGNTDIWPNRKRPGLLDALELHGLPATISADEKKAMREVILGPEYEQRRPEIQAYNRTDVWATLALMPVMAPTIDVPHALFRGRYMGADARMMHAGLPVDQGLLGRFLDNWDNIRRFYIKRDDEFGLYEDLSFREWRLQKLIDERGWDWPRTKSGALETKAQTFGRQVCRYPELKKTAHLRQTIGDLKLSSIANTIGADGRSRCALMPFWTRTGRNQPSEKDKIFLAALPAWTHGFIAPPLGEGIAELDFKAQEIGVMAAASGDPAMIADYLSGEPYLGFAERAGLMPEDTAKIQEFRNKCCKPVVLGQNYGMTAYGIQAKTGKSFMWARDIHVRHRQTYPVFHKWLDDMVAQAKFDRVIYSPFGWPQSITGSTTTRSIKNYPAQSGGSDMMRIAAIAATEDGISVAAPVHDAFWITAPMGELRATVERMDAIMRRAGLAVTAGLPIDVEVAAKVRWPQCLGDTRTANDKGHAMWVELNQLISSGDLKKSTGG